jgi:hypothetical protein
MYTLGFTGRVSDVQAKASPSERHWCDAAPADDAVDFVSDAPRHDAFVSAPQTEEVG